MSTAPPASAEGLENPLIAGLERLPVHPTTLVIFGATGDLAHRKLLPALYNLAHEGALPERFELIGVGRRDQEHEDFRETIVDSIERYSRQRPDPGVLNGLLDDARYVQGSFDDDEIYTDLAQTLKQFDERAGRPLDRVFYLSTAPEFFPLIARKLGAAGLNDKQGAEVRIVLEKPFGYDLASARQLNADLLEVFEEPQIFRIDHYLGKETVQNLMALRFANALFEPVWNRNYIDHVQITAAEDIGIGGRAGYYEGAGALARPGPEPHAATPGPAGDGAADGVRRRPPARREAQGAGGDRASVDRRRRHDGDARPVRPRGGRRQASARLSGGGRRRCGLRTPTYAALRLHVSNWRWAGVPFYLRTGKRLARKLTEIAVILKPVPHLAFQSSGSVGIQANQIVFTLQPDEGVSVSIGAKIPGSRMRIRPVNMEFRYGTSFLSESPEAYERLILDAMRSDATLFTRNDEIEALWGIIDPILDAWQEDTTSPIPQYESGTAGPEAAAQLLDEGTIWRRL